MRARVWTENKFYLLLIVLFSVAGTFLFVQVVMDDAYIPFRYGYNLVNYGIWNYYPNTENLVEAYTTFSYAALSVLPPLLHIHPYVVFKLAGCLLFCGIIALLYKSTADRKIALLAILIFTANWQTYVHTYSGLETLLWCFLLLKVFFITRDAVHPKQQILLWIICLLLPLTRPEGVLIGLAVFIYLRFIRNSTIHYRSLIVCLIIGCCYFALRWYYFGLALPLPFFQKSVKSNAGIFHLIVNSFSSLHYIVVLVLFIMLLKRNQQFRFWGITALVVFYSVYGTSLLSMNFADRFSYQLLFPVILYGISSMHSASVLKQVKIRYLSIFLVLFVFAKGFYSNHAKDLSSMGDNLFSGYYYSRTHLNLALEFRKLNNSNIKVFCNEAGIFPYYANVDYYDPEGLTNKALSVKTITPEYIEQVNPDAFLYLVTMPVQEVNNWAANLPSNHPLAYYRYLLENETYEKLGYVSCIDYNAYIGVAVRKTSPFYEQVRKAGLNAIAASEENKFTLRRFLKFRYSASFPVL
jgi:hypothetical protein